MVTWHTKYGRGSKHLKETWIEQTRQTLMPTGLQEPKKWRFWDFLSNRLVVKFLPPSTADDSRHLLFILLTRMNIITLTGEQLSSLLFAKPKNFTVLFEREYFKIKIILFLALFTKDFPRKINIHAGNMSLANKPKSVASIIYLDVVNNYTVIQLGRFCSFGCFVPKLRRKCAKSEVLFLPTASQSFFRL